MSTMSSMSRILLVSFGILSASLNLATASEQQGAPDKSTGQDLNIIDIMEAAEAFKGKNMNQEPPTFDPTDHPTADCDCDATRNEPICCFGQEYVNECWADCDGIDVEKCKSGKCTESNHIDQGCVCATDSNPMCCNGKQYDNACLAECDGVSKPAEFYCVSGQCDDKENACKCPMIYEPHCCQDFNEEKQSFSNLCLAKCAGYVEKDCQVGSCADKACVCPLIFDPQCCNNQDYMSVCDAKCDGIDEQKCKQGTCDEVLCECTKEYDPLCCDGRDYVNPCAAQCDGIKSPAAEQTDICFSGPCEPFCECTNEYDPICCSGKDYYNSCHAECHEVERPQDTCFKGTC